MLNQRSGTNETKPLGSAGNLVTLGQFRLLPHKAWGRKDYTYRSRVFLSKRTELTPAQRVYFQDVEHLGLAVVEVDRLQRGMESCKV